MKKVDGSVRISFVNEDFLKKKKKRPHLSFYMLKKAMNHLFTHTEKFKNHNHNHNHNKKTKILAVHEML